MKWRGIMQKSMQKKMIILKTQESRCFEEVYLILRDHIDSISEENGIVEEANRIIRQAQSCRIYQKRPLIPSSAKLRFLWFFGGVLTTLAIVTLTALLISLLF